MMNSTKLTLYVLSLLVGMGTICYAVNIYHIGTNAEFPNNVTADNIHMPAYIRAPANNTQAVTVGSQWQNITFDKTFESLKLGFTHEYTDATNISFTPQYTGDYAISYYGSFIDSAANPSAHVAMRLLNHDGTTVRGSYTEEDTAKQNTYRKLKHSFVTSLVAGMPFTVQFVSDDTTVSLTLHNTFHSGGSAAQLNIHRIG